MYPALIISLLGVLTALSWGTADFFAAKASRRTSPEATTLWVSLIGTLAFASIYVVHPGDLGWTQAGILYAVAAGVSLELGLLMLFRGLDAGPVSIVSPISSAYPVVSTLIVLSVFGGSLRVLEMVGILITVVGLSMASGLLDIKKSDKKFTVGVVYGIISFLLLGLAYAMLGESVVQIGWQKSALIDTFAGLLALVVTLALISRQNLKKALQERSYGDKFVLLTALAQLIGGIVFTIGLAHAKSAAVITAISATYPVLTIFLALTHFGEKKQLVPLIGAFITIAGVIILSI
jgi:uncharacterized membrane protein